MDTEHAAKAISEWIRSEILTKGAKHIDDTALIAHMELRARNTRMIKSFMNRNPGVTVIWLTHSAVSEWREFAPQLPNKLILIQLNESIIEAMPLAFQRSSPDDFMCRINHKFNTMALNTLSGESAYATKMKRIIRDLQFTQRGSVVAAPDTQTWAGVVVIFQPIYPQEKEHVRSQLHTLYQNGLHLCGQLFECIYIQSPMCTVRLTQQPYVCTLPHQCIENYHIRRCLGVSPLREVVHVLTNNDDEKTNITETFLSKVGAQLSHKRAERRFPMYNSITDISGDHEPNHTPNNRVLDSILIIHCDRVLGPKELSYTLLRHNVISMTGKWVASGCVLVMDILRRDVGADVIRTLLEFLICLGKLARRNNSDVIILAGHMAKYRSIDAHTRMFSEHTVCMARICNWVIMDTDSTNWILDKLHGVDNNRLLAHDVDYINQAFRTCVQHNTHPKSDMDMAIGLCRSNINRWAWVRTLKRVESHPFVNPRPYEHIAERLRIDSMLTGGMCSVGTEYPLHITLGNTKFQNIQKSAREPVVNILECFNPRQHQQKSRG
jgi:hypothetical protein